jgi:hypothetical protein
MSLWFWRKTLRIPVRSLRSRRTCGFWAEFEEICVQTKKVPDKFPAAGKTKNSRDGKSDYPLRGRPFVEKEMETRLYREKTLGED